MEVAKETNGFPIVQAMQIFFGFYFYFQILCLYLFAIFIAAACDVYQQVAIFAILLPNKGSE